MDNSFGLEGTSRLIPVNWRQNAAPEEGTSCRRLHRRILSILGWRYVRSPFLFSQVTMQSLSGNCRCQKARSGDSGDVMFPGLKAIRSRPSRCSARCAFGRFSAERPNNSGYGDSDRDAGLVAETGSASSASSSARCSIRALSSCETGTRCTISRHVSSSARAKRMSRS